MTRHIGTAKEKHKCAWCGYPGATHQGGYQKKSGGTEEDWFCNAEHFTLWLRWRSSFTQIKEQQRIVPFSEVKA